jgi:hypothetical protein
MDAETEGYLVVFGIESLIFAFKQFFYDRIYGKIAGIDSETITEQVGKLVKKLMYVAGKIAEAAGNPAALYGRGGNIVNG